MRALRVALLIGPLLQSKGRVLTATLAIAAGVALGYAVQAVNQAAVSEFGEALRIVAGDADLSVRGARSGFDEALYPWLVRQPEVAVASPMIEVQARVPGHQATLRVLGVDVFRAARIQPGLLGESADALDMLRADVVYLNLAASRWLGATSGGQLSVRGARQLLSLRVAGWIAAGSDAEPLAIMDLGAVQQHFARSGRLTRVDLRLRPGVDLAGFEARLRGALPAGVHSERPQQSLDSSARASRAYRVNLSVLALVALFTGALLVFSTQALSLLRRRPQLALLRALGMTRRQLLRLLLAEGALIGLPAALLGVLAGHLLAKMVLQVVGADLGAGQFRGLQPELQLQPGMMALFVALGLGAALLGNLIPALEAVRAPPARGLKAGDANSRLQQLQPSWPGLLLIALGIAACALPPVGDLPIFGYLAIALLLVGSIALVPRAAALLLSKLPAANTPGLHLAQSQLAHAPGAVGLALAAMVAAVTLTVSMLIMVHSFRLSLQDWLDVMLPAHVYVRAPEGAPLSTQEQRHLMQLPGTRRLRFTRFDQLRLRVDQPPLVLIARDLPDAAAHSALPLVGASLPIDRAAPPPVWISEAVVDLYGWRVGHIVTLPLAGQSHRFTVVGVWRDYTRQSGAVIIERQRYVALTGDDSASDAALWHSEEAAVEGAVIEEIVAAVRAALPRADRLEFATTGQMRRMSLQLFDRTFAVTYALEAVAVVIGLFGLSSALASQVTARRREFGMLRHVGMSRGQIVGMLIGEGALVSAIGLVVGLMLGALVSVILIYVVNRQSFHWSMDMHLPWAGLALFALVMLGAAALTAALSGRRAVTLDAVRAVKDDW